MSVLFHYTVLQEPLLARDVERQVLHLGNGNSPLPEAERRTAAPRGLHVDHII